MKKMNLGSRTVCVSPYPPLWITELFCRWNFTVERIFRAIVGAKWREELCQPWLFITSCTVVHWKPGIIVSSERVLHVHFLKKLVLKLFFKRKAGLKKTLPVIFCRNRQNPLIRCFHSHSFCHFSSYQLPKFSKFHRVVDSFFLRELSSTFDVPLPIGNKVLAKQMFDGNRKFDRHQQFARHLNGTLIITWKIPRNF